MPTLAAVDRDLSLVVGERATAWPERSVIRSVKSRLLEGGSSLEVRAPNGVVHKVDVDDVVCAVLSEAAARIERSMGVPVDGDVRARLGCPAVWTAEPRRRLAALAGKAGFDLGVADILDEPIAAGVSWVMGRFARGEPVPEGRVVVFDCGGGTLDVAVLEVRPASPPEITVLSAAGLAEAGDALDAGIAGDLAVDLQSSGIDVQTDDRAPELQRLLRLAAQRLKEQLTLRPRATTEIGGDFDHVPTLHYERTRLETVFAPQLTRSLRLVFACLRAADLRHRGWNDATLVKQPSNERLADGVAYVLLVGGMTRVPAVAARLAGEFPGAIVESDPGVESPEESVVNGLTFDDVVSDLNLHRPGFDFVVRFLDGGGEELDRQVVYPAYSPLYSSHEIFTGGFLLGYESAISIPTGARMAELSCVDVEGDPLQLHVDNERRHGLEIDTGYKRTMQFKLYVDGTVLIAAAARRKFRVERWPVLRSGLSRPTIGLRTLDKSAQDEPDPGWWHGGE